MKFMEYYICILVFQQKSMLFYLKILLDEMILFFVI